MLRRLLAYLLILCLAAPALASAQNHQPVPADMSHAATSHHGHHMPKPSAPSQAETQHDCIGCIAPYSDDLRVGGEVVVFGATPAPGIADQLAGFAIPPALPPPRA